jgi:hypothetical protein
MYRNGCTLLLCQFDRFLSSFLDTGQLQSGDLYNGTAQLLRQLRNVDLVTVFIHNIDHVDSHDNGDTQFHQLCAQI